MLLAIIALICVVAVIVAFAFLVDFLIRKWTGRKRRSQDRHDTSINDLINRKNDRDE